MTTAETRFAGIWAEEKIKWANGNVAVTTMKDGATVPVDYCLTTIARIKEQKDSPIDQLETAVGHLREAAGQQFFYPRESLHVSLLGCTQRAASRHAFGADQIDRIDEAVAATLRGHSPARIALRGLNVAGPQVFVQCFPFDDTWAQLRGDIEEALLLIGEKPIAYANKLPIHLNIMRVMDGDKKSLSRTLHCVEELRDKDFGVVELSCIEFLMTDFVVSSSNSQVLKQYHLR